MWIWASYGAGLRTASEYPVADFCVSYTPKSQLNTVQASAVFEASVVEVQYGTTPLRLGGAPALIAAAHSGSSACPGAQLKCATAGT